MSPAAHARDRELLARIDATLADYDRGLTEGTSGRGGDGDRTPHAL